MPRTTSFATLIFATSLSLSAFAVDRDANPPGPVGGPGTNWENPPGPQGGPSAGPDRPNLSPEQIEKLKAMTPEQRQRFFQEMREKRKPMRPDRDNNPPGTVGGPGTNWENRPGPQGGPGASPDRRPLRDRDNNPPGAVGGPGTNWENPPGPQGGPGASPDRRPQRDRDNNPPGAVGGPGTNWENPPGPQGGPGAGPDRPNLTMEQREKLKAMTPQQRQRFFENMREQRKQSRPDRDNNPPGSTGGPGTNWENPPGPEGGPGASPDRQPLRDRDNNPPGSVGGPGTNWENPRGPRGGPGASPDRRQRDRTNRQHSPHRQGGPA